MVRLERKRDRAPCATPLLKPANGFKVSAIGRAPAAERRQPLPSGGVAVAAIDEQSDGERCQTPGNPRPEARRFRVGHAPGT